MRNTLFLGLSFLLIVGCSQTSHQAVEDVESYESNYVDIKYSDDDVDIGDPTFESVDTSKSSFVTGAWYDESSDYMIIMLNDTYYQYCNVSGNEWRGFSKASSFGKYYNSNIKGNYDCLSDDSDLSSFDDLDPAPIRPSNTISKSYDNLSYADISSVTPDNYVIFDFYYENLDDDNLHEVILIFEEHPDYTTEEEFGSDVDYFRRLPVMFSVLDFEYGKWNYSFPRVIAPGDNHFYYGMDNPYRIIVKDTGHWIIFYTFHTGFGGTSSDMSIFSFSGLGDIYEIDTNEVGSEFIYDTGDKIYFASCYPYLGQYDHKLEMEEVDVSGNYPKIKSIDFGDGIDCQYFWDNMPDSFPPVTIKRHELFKNLLYSKGWNLPVD